MLPHALRSPVALVPAVAHALGRAAALLRGDAAPHATRGERARLVLAELDRALALCKRLPPYACVRAARLAEGIACAATELGFEA